jgi:pimeloyl-ACP methyl ester carboxylesterase
LATPLSSRKSTNVRTTLTCAVPAVFAALERTAPSVAGWWADRLFFTPPRPPLSLRLQSILSAGLRSEVPFGAGRLPAWRWGRGPTVLLVHGWGSRGGHFGALVTGLVEGGFSAVAFDAPAHGAAAGRRTNVPEIARATAAVAEALGSIHGIVAHSAGAAAAALALVRGLRAARVVFLAPAGNPDGFTRAFAARLGLGPASLRAMRRRAERRIGLRFDELDLRALSRGQHAPLLVVHDREDREIGWSDGAAVADAWPGAELFTTRGLGHHRLLKDAGVLARVVAFLGGREGRACGHEGGCTWDGRAELCPSCALERDLFDREGRRTRSGPAARAGAPYLL